MDLGRLSWKGRGIRLAFGGGVLFCTLCVFWFDGFLSASRKLTLAPPRCEEQHLSDHVNGSSMGKKRLELYDNMSRDLDNNGAVFLDGGETSQSLKLAELFKITDGKVTPVHKPANPAVRANVLHLQYQYASKIVEIVESVLSPHFSKGLWYQDPQLYHFTLFHASHHLEPVSATKPQVHDEAMAVEQVAKNCCPLNIVLNRVVLTSTGVLLGCWQVLNGTDPAFLRKELSKVLPHSPKKQLYAPEILHTSFARIFVPPDLLTKDRTSRTEIVIHLQTLVLRLNDKLCNFQARVEELWFVEEFDVLALALQGRMHVQRFPLQCFHPWSSVSPATSM